MQIMKVCVDASFSPDTGVATYAAVIRTPEKEHELVGRLPGFFQKSEEAERQAVLRVLWTLDKTHDLKNYHLALYCDCFGVVQPSDWREDELRPLLRQARTHDILHVKAHLPQRKWERYSGEEVHKMNAWCDTRSRLLLRELLRKKDY